MSFYEKLVIAPIKFVFDLNPLAFIISIIILTAVSVYFLTVKLKNSSLRHTAVSTI